MVASCPSWLVGACQCQALGELSLALDWGGDIVGLRFCGDVYGDLPPPSILAGRGGIGPACGCIGGGVECGCPGCIMTGVGLMFGDTISGG